MTTPVFLHAPAPGAPSAPRDEGIELLDHHLANVREGAVKGIRKNSDVSLLEKLYWKRKETDKPWFRHAAYRAIDDILLNIEAIGKQKEFDALQSLFDRLKEREGNVGYRLVWNGPLRD